MQIELTALREEVISTALARERPVQDQELEIEVDQGATLVRVHDDVEETILKLDAASQCLMSPPASRWVGDILEVNAVIPDQDQDRDRDRDRDQEERLVASESKCLLLEADVFALRDKLSKVEASLKIQSQGEKEVKEAYMKGARMARRGSAPSMSPPNGGSRSRSRSRSKTRRGSLSMIKKESSELLKPTKLPMPVAFGSGVARLISPTGLTTTYNAPQNELQGITVNAGLAAYNPASSIEAEIKKLKIENRNFKSEIEALRQAGQRPVQDQELEIEALRQAGQVKNGMMKALTLALTLPLALLSSTGYNPINPILKDLREREQQLQVVSDGMQEKMVTMQATIHCMERQAEQVKEPFEDVSSVDSVKDVPSVDSVKDVPSVDSVKDVPSVDNVQPVTIDSESSLLSDLDDATYFDQPACSNLAGNEAKNEEAKSPDGSQWVVSPRSDKRYLGLSKVLVE